MACINNIASSKPADVPQHFVTPSVLPDRFSELLGSEIATDGAELQTVEANLPSLKPLVSTVTPNRARVAQVGRSRRDDIPGDSRLDHAHSSASDCLSALSIPATGPPPAITRSTASTSAKDNPAEPEYSKAVQRHNEITTDPEDRCDTMVGQAATSAPTGCYAGPLSDRGAELAGHPNEEPVVAAAIVQPKPTAAKVTRGRGEPLLAPLGRSAVMWQQPLNGPDDRVIAPVQIEPGLAAAPPLSGSTARDAAVPSATTAPAGADHSVQPALVPSQQIGQALATLHSAADGSSHTVIRLDPGDLGALQIRITRTHSGVASVSVAVEKSETLRTLQADLSSLHQALDRAGLPEHRSVALHLTSQGPEPGGHQSLPQGGQGGAPGHGHTGQEKGFTSGKAAGLANEQTQDERDQLTRQHWFRPGVDITA